MAKKPLSALILEDSEDDALLVVRALEEQGFDVTWERIWTAAAMKASLDAKSWDVVLSDYCMPSFDVPGALRVLPETGHDLPFLVISGTIGDAAAVAAMKGGAHDYLMKGNLNRLGASIEREMAAARVRADQKAAAKRIQHLNAVLRAIRNVNQLIVREKEPAEILRQSCIELVDTRGYDAAWIAITEDRSPFGRLVVERGFGEAFDAMRHRLEQGLVPPCCEEAAAAGTVHVIRHPHSECPTGCSSLEGATSNCQRAAMTMVAPLKSNGRTHGFMCVAIAPELDIDDEETTLVQEVAGDIGFALWSIETEGERRKEEEKFRLTFDNASIGKVLTAPDGKLARVNQAFCDLLGYSGAELEAKSFAEVTHPDDLGISREAVRCLLAGEQTSFRFDKRYLRRDGQPVWADVSTILLRDPDGTPVNFITHVLDLTERKQMQSQIAQSDRLASMGMLAAGVAHEINNPLCYILYNLESLTDDLSKISSAMRKCLDIVVARDGDGEWARLMGQEQELLNPAMLDDIRARFKDALQGTQRIRDIARGLGVFSRVEQDRVVPVALMQVIEVAINMVFNEIKYRARLVKEYGKTSTILANDGRLSQVFLNLFINAAHAIQEGDVESNEIRVRTWQEGEEVFAEVRDTGKGISETHLPHVFEPFFTTKEIGVGTGLGLPISKSIVEEYGGRIDVESEVGKGTRFTVRLPVKKAEEFDEAVLATPALAQPAVSGRILVVDDEPGIRGVIVRMLRGHNVVEAASGEDARKLLEADQAFDLILCDMMMSSMSGVQLHEWLEVTHPVLAKQFVFITGGAFTPKAREYLTKVSNLRLEKPFDVANFKKIVSELLRGAR